MLIAVTRSDLLQVWSVEPCFNFRSEAQVLPNATHRGGRQFQDNYGKSEIQPVRAPLETLIDVDHLMAWAAASDAIFHRVREGNVICRDRSSWSS